MAYLVKDHSKEKGKEVVELVKKSGSKSWKKRFSQINYKLRNAVYPAHVESYWVISVLVMALHFATNKVPFDLVTIVANQFPG